MVLKVFVADTPTARVWGLMGHSRLWKNGGMLFPFDEPRSVNFWMFNCYMDLAVAYLDELGVIREIHELKSYPKMMDAKRPVGSLRDMAKYPEGDPIRTFFEERGAQSEFEVSGALEMASGWFEANGFGVGDRVVMEKGVVRIVSQGR